MFIHNFKYAFKTLFRNRMLIFWTFAFPIILGTFFNMAFSNIENSEKLDIIDIAIVDNDDFKNNQIFRETFKTLGDENNEERLFEIQYVNEDKAKELLEEDKIAGYLKMIGNEPKIFVTTSGIDETILKYVTEEIQQTTEIMQNVAEYKMQNQSYVQNIGDLNNFYAQIYEEVLEILNMDSNIENISNSKLSYTMIEFYTLIAMTCLYGGILGMVAINQNLANMSSNGKRVSVSPMSKGKMILGSLTASYITQIIGVALLFVYTIFVLKVDYGNNLPLIILLALIGCLAGLSLGIAIATLFKTNDNVKTGIVISVTMVRMLFIWNDGNYYEIYYRQKCPNY